MTRGATGGSRPWMDPVEMQRRVTGIREALDQARKMRAVPKFPHTADPSLFIDPDPDPKASAGR